MRAIFWLCLLIRYAASLSVSVGRSKRHATILPQGSFTLPNIVKQNGSSVPENAKFLQCLKRVSGVLDSRLIDKNHKQIRMANKMQQCGRDFGNTRWEPENMEVLKIFEPAEMLSILANRRIVFVGDSVAFHLWMYFGCLLQQESSISKLTSSSFTWADHSMRFAWQQPNNITLEFVGGGRNYELSPFYKALGPRPINLASVFPQILEGLEPTDVVLVNSGVHDNSYEELTDDREKHGYSELEPLLPFDRQLDRAGTTDTTQVAHAVAQAVTERRARDPSRVPMVIWRESTPQHYHKHKHEEADGLYPLNPRNDSAWHKRCSPLDTDLLDETSSANMRNTLTRPILDQADIPILAVWKALSTHADAHCMKMYDCTHWEWAINHIILQGFMNLLLNA